MSDKCPWCGAEIDHDYESGSREWKCGTIGRFDGKVIVGTDCVRSVVADRDFKAARIAELEAENARLRARLGERADDARVKYLETPRPADEWHEDYGAVIWWYLPCDEAPYIGTPLDSDWVDDFYTHWTPLPPTLCVDGGWENKSVRALVAALVEREGGE